MTRRRSRLIIRVDHDGRVSLSMCPCCTGPVEALDMVDMVADKLEPLAEAAHAGTSRCTDTSQTEQEDVRSLSI